MKKIILIIMAMFVLSCEPIIDIINYFAEITANITEGTTETEFTFTVDTNDELEGIYANDILLEENRGISYSFDPGNYTIVVKTINGANDSIEIIVNDIPIIYETRFIINVTDNDSVDTSMELNYPILTTDGIDFNLETMTPNVNGFPVKTVYADTERLVYINITCSWGRNSFIFRDSYNWSLHLDFLREDLNIENMNTLIEFIHYVEPEPTFDSVLFNLSGTEGIADILVLTEDSYLINGVETSFIDADGVQVDTTKTVDIHINVGNKDDFLLRDINLIKFFGYDTVDMTKEEVLQTIDILNRYPEEYLLDIVFDYWPTNPVLDEMGYFD